MFSSILSKLKSGNRFHTPGVWSSTPQGCGMVVMVIVMLCVAFNAFAAEPEVYKLQPGEEWKTVENSAEGELVMINPGRLVLEYGVSKNSAREIQLDLGDEKEIKIFGVKRLSDFGAGDIVRVAYTDKFVENKDKKYSQYKRTVHSISLVRSGAQSASLKSFGTQGGV